MSVVIMSGYSQDPAFTQAYANPLYLNPAFAGTGTSQRIGLDFRDQWPLLGLFTTYNVSYDRNVFDSLTGIGVLANQDVVEPTKLITNNVSLIFSRQIHIKSFTLSAGIQLTYHQKTVYWSNLTFGNFIDPMYGFVYGPSDEWPTRDTIAVLDFSLGLLGYGENYFVGFSVDHITQPDESFITGASPLPIKDTFNAGWMINTNGVIISPTILYIKQQDLTSLSLECYATEKYFTEGVGYRWGSALIFTAGFQNKFFRIGYSYDYIVSALNNNTTGGCHEASLAVSLPYHLAKLNKQRGINCPFF